jgi:hypothetical protein
MKNGQVSQGQPDNVKNFNIYVMGFPEEKVGKIADIFMVEIS